MTANMYRDHIANPDDMWDVRRLPNGHLLHDGGWTLFPGGIHRDSGPLDESNHAIILRQLCDVAHLDPMEAIAYIGTDSTQEHYEKTGARFGLAHFRHWAVGWVDEVLIDREWANGINLRTVIARRLDTYPVLDEDDWYQREWAANHPTPDECYSDDPDCPCKENP